MTANTKKSCCSTTTGACVENDVIVKPQADILETDAEAVVYLDLPGVSGDGLTVRYEDGELHIEGEVGANDARQYLRQEFVRGSFRRSFAIGEAIEAEGIEAALKDGVLRVRLPKSAAAKSRRIQVRSE